MISELIKRRIIDEIQNDRKKYSSAFQQSEALGINQSQLSRIVNGDTVNVISEKVWILLAQHYDIPVRKELKVETARTAVFNHIYKQLEFAQENSVSAMLCDRADIGKTHTALIYARENKNVAYVDCGRNKTKIQFIRAISRQFGLQSKGTFVEMLDRLVLYIKTSDRPLIILDEFGDLRYEAYLEVKALWNAVDKHCGWYAMGADGLKAKIDRHIGYNKVGFAEIKSRFGNKFQKITPETDAEFKKFQRKQIAQIGRANKCADVQKLYAKTDLSLRRIPIQLGLERKQAEK